MNPSEAGMRLRVAGAVMGFALCGLGMLMLYATMLLFRVHYSDPKDWIYLTECITGYGLGGSCIAMFGRVGGGACQRSFSQKIVP